MRFLLLFLLAVSAHGQIANILPAHRYVDYPYRDIVGNAIVITNRSVYTNLDVNSGDDLTEVLNLTLPNCPSNEVVRIPAGNFTVTNDVYLYPHITIQGAGMHSTWINFLSGRFSRANDNGVQTSIQSGPRITGNLSRGQTNFTVSDASSITVGKMVIIARFNSSDQYDTNLVIATGGQSDTNSPTGFLDRTVRRVLAKAGNDITCWPPLERDSTNAPFLAYPLNLVSKYIGISDMTVTVSNTVFGMNFEGCMDSYVKRVKFMQAKNHNCRFAESIGIEFTDNWVNDGKDGGSNGSGLLFETVGCSLVVNNILVNNFPCVEINTGSYRNVVAYNYLFNQSAGNYELDSNHGAHNSFNLYEGNLCPRFLSDGYFGGASDDMIFRNWFTGQELGSTVIGYVLALKKFHRNGNILGNILGYGNGYSMAYNGMSFGTPDADGDNGNDAPPWPDFPTGGNPASPTIYQEEDTNVLFTAIIKKNFNYFDMGIPASEANANTNPYSMYSTGKPWFFPNNYTWPIANSDNVNTNFNMTNTYILPAQYAYFNGGVWPTDSADTFVTNAPPRLRGFRFK